MRKIVIFAVGSPLVAEVEESAARAGLTIAAGIRNVPGENHLTGDAPIMSPAELTPDVLGLPFLVPLFGPGNRQRAATEAAGLGFAIPFSLIDPTAIRPRNLPHGAGCYVNAGCIVGAAATLGDFVVVNRGASVGHHVTLADFASVGPGAILAGQVSLGRGAVIGAGAVIMPNIKVGENAVVAAGAVVGKDVPPFCLAIGNPARLMKKDIDGYGGVAVT